MTIVIAWMSTRADGCPGLRKKTPCAAVWLNQGKEQDLQNAHVFAKSERERNDGTSEHAVFQFPEGTTDPLDQARALVSNGVW